MTTGLGVLGQDVVVLPALVPSLRAATGKGVGVKFSESTAGQDQARFELATMWDCIILTRIYGFPCGVDTVASYHALDSQLSNMVSSSAQGGALASVKR